MVSNSVKKEILGNIIDSEGVSLVRFETNDRIIFILPFDKTRIFILPLTCASGRSYLLKSSGGRCAGALQRPPTLMAAQLCCVVTRYPEGVMHVEVQPKCNGPEKTKSAYTHITAEKSEQTNLDVPLGVFFRCTPFFGLNRTSASEIMPEAGR